MKRTFILIGLLVIVTLAVIFKPYIRSALSPVMQKLKKQQTVSQRLGQYGDAARARLKPHFAKAGVVYPPQRVTLVGLKEERVLHVYAEDTVGTNRWIRSYKILAASGRPGPKLREGDRQVPEGIYTIESLNPNSRYHLSLRLGYPNTFDREQAAKESRTNLGGDIMIHGSSVSVGCLAMGDEAAEDLFVLAADTDIEKITVILAPLDFRAGKSLPDNTALPDWTKELYPQIKARLTELPAGQN